MSSANSAPQTIVVTDPTAATGTSSSVTSTVVRPLAPTISIANPNLSVTEGGGTVGLGITVSPNTVPSATIVTIQGLPSYETITDNRDQLTFQGNLITLTGAEVNSGLTLTSNYQGAGHPVATLTITGTTDQGGVSSAMSAPKTIVVTGPPATANDPSSTLAAMLCAAKTAGTDFAGRWGERDNSLTGIAAPFLSERNAGIRSLNASDSDTALLGSLAAASGFGRHFGFHS